MYVSLMYVCKPYVCTHVLGLPNSGEEAIPRIVMVDMDQKGEGAGARVTGWE
jgi:hypothetical protein